MKHIVSGIFSGILVSLFASTAHAGFIDWGIDPAGGDWSSSNSERLFFENWTSGGGGFLGPGWGGQDFDVEAIYARHNGSSVDFAIVTGFDPVNGVDFGGKHYTPGDIFFNVDNAGWNTAIELSTGDVYENVVGTIPEFNSSAPFTIASGDNTGINSPLTITQDGAHYLIEGTFDLAAIGADGAPLGIHWTMSCGNDVGRGMSQPVPEPATVALFGIGSGLVALKRRKQRKARAAAA